MQNITTDNVPDAPRIEFPCQYPIKVVGDVGDQFKADVLAIFQRHAPATREQHIVERPSSQGRFVALTVEIEATGLAQLEALFADLKNLPAVKLVL